MLWLFHLHETAPVAQAIGILAVVCVAGMAVGSIKVRGIGLGTSGVLFAGLVLGHFSKPVDRPTLDFVKEFGLLLFVFTIGLQLGPGFFSALRRDGVRLNGVALLVIVSGSALAVALGKLLGLDAAATLGVLSGATTNTPSLAAAQQTLATFPGVSEGRQALPAAAYAVTYPVAIAGMIGSLLALKSLFHVNPVDEADGLAARRQRDVEVLEVRTLVVENQQLAGVTIDAIPSLIETGVIVSRHRRVGECEVRPALGHTCLQLGDCMTVVGRRAMLDQFQRMIGRESREDLRFAPGNVTDREIVVTRENVLGKTVGDLAIDARCDVVVSRVTRAGVALTAVPGLTLQFGDVVQAVGDENGLARTEQLLGNSVEALGETRFVPLFVGIVLGIIVGTMPIAVPGLQQPLELGLAGGSLIVALVLSRLGRIGRLVFYMPANTNLAFREFGIALFFAAAGLAAGPSFFASAFSATGVLWLAAGAGVAIVPVLVAGVVARMALRMDFTVLCGLLAGTMTDPPALTFAINLTGSDAPMLSYVAVYPLTMVLRILTAQVLTLILIR